MTTLLVNRLKLPFYLTISVILVGLLFPRFAVLAQSDTLDGPVYQVEEGDNLWSIALKFGVSVDELSAANGIINPNQLAVGADLIIPGLQGVEGRLVTREIPFGENLSSLSRLYHLPKTELARLNRIVNPQQAFWGSDLILLDSAAELGSRQRMVLHQNVSPLELSAIAGSNPWSVLSANMVSNQWELQQGETVLAGGEGDGGPLGLPEMLSAANVKPERIEQGSTVVVAFQAADEIEMSGKFGDQDLMFFTEDQQIIAMQGVHALQQPGFYPLSIEGRLSDGTNFGYSQWVYIGEAGYPFDPVLIVDPSVVDPAVTEPENEQVNALIAPASAEKMWNGQFSSPVAPQFSECFPSGFGHRRSYNGSPYSFFHTGLDFCGAVGDDIYAPAPGIVVFAGPLTVRGNTTIIDHGWGVYTVYMHQSEILVGDGDAVDTGQLIGKVGATGRVTGPHLHWEVWAGGVQADPINWLQQTYP
jgi:murein DD-endopeptidase MepM/ murein hydrolase activator NlpD